MKCDELNVHILYLTATVKNMKRRVIINKSIKEETQSYQVLKSKEKNKQETKTSRKK
jgi:hypothetical protein